MSATAIVPARESARPLLTLPLSAMLMGLYILAASRSGKSRLLGRELVWQGYYWEIPQIVFDATGIGTIDNFLDKLIRQLQYVEKQYAKRLLRRIKYVNMASSDYIVPFPLIYMTGAERSLLHVAEHYLHVIRLSYPQLLEAQVQGFPPLHYISVHTHILLAALGLPITLAENLLRNPEKWRNTSKFAEAVRRYLEAAASVAFFQEEYIPARPADRRRLLNPYLEKIFIYNLDVNLRCQFGTATPGIDWEEVEAEGQTILLDFRDELDPEMRRFKLLWVFSSLYEYIKRRGRREQPLSICIDEFSAMGNKVTEGTNPLATLLDEFIQQYLRSSNIWLTVAHQSIEQIDEQLRTTLFSLGTYLFGRATIPEARILADVLYKRNPFRVKHWRKVWGSQPLIGSGGHYANLYEVIDFEPEFMNLEEQQEEAARRIAELGLFQFLCRPAVREGEVSQSVIPLTIANLDRDDTAAISFPTPSEWRDFALRLKCKQAFPLRHSSKSLTPFCLLYGQRRDAPQHRRRMQLFQRSHSHLLRLWAGRLPVGSGSPKERQTRQGNT